VPYPALHIDDLTATVADVCSQRAGERVMSRISRFITERLKLKVHESKRAVDRPQNRSFLGLSFAGGKSANGGKIAAKAWGRFKARVQELTRASPG
jgi:RNA-directed DNA polymerase